MGTFFTYVNYLDENLLYTARPASVGPMHWGGQVQKKPPQLQKMLHGDQSLSPPVIGASVVHSVSAVCYDGP